MMYMHIAVDVMLNANDKLLYFVSFSCYPFCYIACIIREYDLTMQTTVYASINLTFFLVNVLVYIWADGDFF